MTPASCKPGKPGRTGNSCTRLVVQRPGNRGHVGRNWVGYRLLRLRQGHETQALLEPNYLAGTALLPYNGFQSQCCRGRGQNRLPHFRRVLAFPGLSQIQSLYRLDITGILHETSQAHRPSYQERPHPPDTSTEREAGEQAPWSTILPLNQRECVKSMPRTEESA